ncbi:hypothetical protein BJX96DRAFT_160342 [Aspergillus floccosus]
MPSILNSFRDLAVSVVEVISSVCETTYNTLYELLRGFINFFIGISEMALHVVKGLSEVFGGVGRFINGNIIAIAIIAGSIYGYLKYQSRERYLAQNRVKKSS